MAFFPIKCLPENIANHLRFAFGLFFADPSGCANRIRCAIENVLDYEKIKKMSVVRGKRKRKILHDRILEFKNTNSETADKLLAIKWIGNAGSHESTVCAKDVLDGLQLLDSAISDLFDNKSKQASKLAKAINKRKGPLT